MISLRMDDHFTKRLAYLQDALREQGVRSDPMLYMFFGPVDPPIVESLRRQMPSTAFLLHIYVPVPGMRIPDRPDNELTLFIPIEPLNAALECVVHSLATLNIREIRHSFADTPSGRLQAPMQDILRAVQGVLLNRDHDRVSRLLELRCAIRNIPAMVLNGANLPDASAWPAIVCTSGPSLIGALPTLKRYADRMVIVAVGRSVPILMGVDIQPDVIVELDAVSHYNWRHTFKLAGLLTALVTVAPEVSARFGRAVWGRSDMPAVNAIMDSLGIPLADIAASGTVLVTAVDTAIRMGCRHIALAGTDFCLAPDGVSHATGYQVETFTEDDVLSVPGTHGRPVKTTEEFQVNRAAFEAYCAARIGSTASLTPRLYNCTPEGATIAHVFRSDLSSFCKKHRGSLPKRLMPRPSPRIAIPELRSRLGRVRSAFTAYIDLQAQNHACTSSLLGALTQTMPDPIRIQTLQRELADGHAREQSLQCDRTFAPWLEPVFRQCKDVESERAEPMNASLGLVLLDRYVWRSLLTQGLCRDLRADIEAVMKQLENQPSTGSQFSTLSGEFSSHRMFTAFRSLALNFIGAANPSLCEWLKMDRPIPIPSRYDVFYYGSDLPYVRFHLDGVSGGLTGSLVVMKRTVTEGVVAFIQQHQYTPDKDALVVIGPENWWDVIEFTRWCPGADMAVVEPWVDLFSEMIEHCLFLHYLPTHSLVVGVHDRLPDWEATLKARISLWKQRGKRILLYVPQRVRDIPGIRVLRDHVELMIR